MKMIRVALARSCRWLAAHSLGLGEKLCDLADWIEGPADHDPQNVRGVGA